jgi:hypothetical protein
MGLLLTLLPVFLLAVPAVGMAAQPTVNLGTTSSFAVLAGSTITNTGPTTINGDAGGNVGLYPGTAFPGQADVTLTGAVHLADDVARKAKDDLVTAYDDAAGRTPVSTIATQLGGTTLIPGVYDSSAGTFQITGTLTLDAQGDPNAVFIFKTASTLITASNSNVNLINGARYCRVFWKVGSSATLGTNSNFVGHIFALTSITATTGATVQGQLLARNGAVTLDTNTITNGICATAPTTTTSTTTPTSTTTTTSTTTPSTTTTTSSATTSTTTPSSSTTSTTAHATTTTTSPGATTTTTHSTTTTTSNSTTTTTAHSNTTTTTVPGTTTTTHRESYPNTGSPFSNILFIGAALALAGAVARRAVTRKARQ